MNHQQYDASLQHLLKNNPVNITFLSNWFDSVLDQLDLLAEQRAAIKHPRYRGDSREHDLKALLTRAMPPAIAMSNGFVANEYATVSQEQDCLLLDARQATTLVRSEKAIYYPIESVLASIEIKSELNLVELRKIALNCASLRKLQYRITDGKQKDQRKVAYFVFAYSSKWDLAQTAAKFNEVLASVPAHLRPCMIYVLKKGFLMPSASGNLAIGPQALFEHGPFKAQGAMRVAKSMPETHAIPFLWFLSNIIDHCTSELFARPWSWVGEYVFAPLILQQQVESQIAKRAVKEASET